MHEKQERWGSHRVILLYWPEFDPSERNVAKIAEFLGIAITMLPLNDYEAGNEDQLRSLIPAGACVIASTKTLARLAQSSSGSSLTWKRAIVSSATEFFVYGFEPSPDHNQLLCDLTAGRFSLIQPLQVDDATYSVEDNMHEICRQFTGLRFGPAVPATDSTFVENASGGDYSILIRIDSKPFFVSGLEENCRLLLVACREVADLDERMSENASILKFFSRLVPLMMTLRGALGDESWHNDRPRACFIIDDPLLRKQYGCLNYQSLIQHMQQYKFSASIAFIPWNYRRSDHRIVELFKTYPSRYSLCVHGCDHTAGEFGSADDELLRERAQLALERMALQSHASGLSFDDVMVFPQGIFSTAAIRALQSSGYLAAVNTTPYPRDVQEDVLTLRELMGVAVTKFSNFPLFVRRYPNQLADLAFDLFLGKPALLVEHHSFFRDGYGPLVDVVKWLNALEPSLEWGRLGEICSQACLKRRTPGGEIQLFFFCDRFCLQNDYSSGQRYLLFRRFTTEMPLEGVTVNGSPVEYTCEKGLLEIPVTLGPGEKARINLIWSNSTLARQAIRQRLIYNARVFVRRRLCELRDSYFNK